MFAIPILYCIVLYFGRIPAANAPDALQPMAYCTNLLAQPGVSTRDPSSERRNYLGEKWPVISTSIHTLSVSFTCSKYATWNKRLYFPSKGRRAENFFTLKNLTASAGFEPANLGTKGQHATSRPPQPLCHSPK